jgi:hypothetical protein
MALIDYVNRRYDYLALQNTTAVTVGRRDRKLGLELFNKSTSGAITTGIQKLAQRWLLEFMTERGSMPGLPTRGTNFMRAARTGQFRVPINVRGQFAAANLIIRRNLRAEDRADTPDDERFRDAELLNVAILPGYDVSQASGTTAAFLSLGVKIISVAGDSREIILPIEIVPRT